MKWFDNTALTLVIMGASDKPLLYEEMNELLDAGMK